MEEKILGAGSVVTPAMAAALDRWRGAFYGQTSGGHPARLAATLCSYLATLVTGELEVRLTGSPRAAYLEQQLQPVLRKLQQAVELAAAEGMCVLHPVVEGNNIRVEFVPAHRFWEPTAGWRRATSLTSARRAKRSWCGWSPSAGRTGP